MLGQRSVWSANTESGQPGSRTHAAIAWPTSGSIVNNDNDAVAAQPLVNAGGSVTSTYSLLPAFFTPGGGTDTLSISAAAGVQNHATIVTTGTGSAIAVYYDNAIGQIVGRIVSSTGSLGSVVTLTTTGAQLDTNGAFDNEAVSAARLSNGNIVVTWSAGSSIYARVFTANLVPVTGEIVVGAPTTGFYHEYYPDVAALTGGDFVIAWQDLLGASESHIRVARLTSAGATVTSFTADAPTNLNDERPSVAGLSDGGYVLGFDRRDNAPTPGTQVFGAVYNADNSVRSAVALLAGSGRDVDVAARPGGGFSFYYEGMTGVSHGTNINIINSSDGSLPPLQAPSGTLDSPTNDHGAVAGADSPDGYRLVTWNDSFSSSDHDVWGALLSPTGQVVVDAGRLIGSNALETAGGVFWLDRSTVAVVYGSSTGTQAGDKDGSVEMRAFGIVRTTTGTSSNDTIDFTGDWLYNFVNAGDGNDIIRGGSGDDRLDGGSGVNELYGGPGNDGYNVTTGTDTIVENAGEGDLDYVLTSLTTYTLPANVEGLQSSGGSSVFTGIGNELDNLIYGGSSGNQLFGLGGNDRIYGHVGSDRLDGGPGADMMVGYSGNDTYVVDNIGDVVVEQVGEGTDTVESGIDYTLGANLENLTLRGTADLNGTGNAGINTLIGNSGANILTGDSGNDVLSGAAGDDRLIGGLGADLMIGGTGDDVYVIDDAGDRAIEGAGEGFDVIKSYISFVLAPGSNIEQVRLMGTADLNATGDASANNLAGNDGNNILQGGGGGDHMKGLGGNDTYIVQNATDSIVEMAGNGDDTVKATMSYVLADNANVQVEHLITTVPMATVSINLTGNAFSHDIEGNAGANVLTGGSGADVIQGFGGNDTLIGGGGHDIFVFAAGTGQDSVSDFVSGTDQLDLTAFGFANFAAVQAAMHNVGGSAVIDLGGGNSVTLTGVLTAQLQSGDVIISSGSSAAIEAPTRAHLNGSAMTSGDEVAAGWHIGMWTGHDVGSPFAQVGMIPVL